MKTISISQLVELRQTIISVEDGADANIQNFQVSGITELLNIGIASDVGSIMVVDFATISEISAIGENVDWIGFEGADGATVVVRDSTFSDTVGSSKILYAVAGSELTLERVSVLFSDGGQVNVRFVKGDDELCDYFYT